MRGLLQPLAERYRELGGELRVRTPVRSFARAGAGFVVRTPTGEIEADHVVSTLPIFDTARPGPPEVAAALRRWTEHPVVAGLAMVPLFLTIVVAAHDLVHSTLGLSRRAEDVLLGVVGLLVLESGHAYRISQLQHHRRWPQPEDDPEGDPARMPLWRRSRKARSSSPGCGGGPGGGVPTSGCGWPPRPAAR